MTLSSTKEINKFIHENDELLGYKLKKIKPGANNQVYKLEHNSKPDLLLKKYFSNKNDKRNRLLAEYNFLKYCQEHKIQSVPLPIDAKFVNNIGLYSFIEGVNTSSITEDNIQSFIDFIIEINNFKISATGKNLSIASDACFSLSDYLKSVELRLALLKKIETKSYINKKALNFIENELCKKFQYLKQKTTLDFLSLKIKSEDKIPESERCISPSDFGIHNTLVKNKKIYFIDFEYTGWDDPVKMICDFFIHPANDISTDFIDTFASQILEKSLIQEMQKKRLKLLYPICQLKWCCIILNEFAHLDALRRNFAKDNQDIENKKELQLEKSMALLSKIN